MTQIFTRKQLYDLVWSEPIRALAAKYGISDVGFAKICKRIEVPLPPRGYWAKRQAGKQVTQVSLPPRGFGMPHEIGMGGHNRIWEPVSLEQALTMTLPPPPTFEEDIESVTVRAKEMVGKIKIPKSMTSPHRFIARLLDEDEVRRQKKLTSGYSWEAPAFETSFEQRRLKILNSIFCAVEQLGMKSSVRGNEARDLHIKVGAQDVSFTLDSAKIKEQTERFDHRFVARGERDPMRLVVFVWWQEKELSKTWEDTKTSRVEDHLREIVEEIIIAGELRHRRRAESHYEWLVERKADAEKHERERQAKEKRERQERKERQEKRRVDHLLGQATAFRQAKEIRAYIVLAREANAASDTPVPENEFETWAKWALAQADRIDPVLARQFSILAESEDVSN